MYYTYVYFEIALKDRGNEFYVIGKRCRSRPSRAETCAITHRRRGERNYQFSAVIGAAYRLARALKDRQIIL